MLGKESLMLYLILTFELFHYAPVETGKLRPIISILQRRRWRIPNRIIFSPEILWIGNYSETFALKVRFYLSTVARWVDSYLGKATTKSPTLISLVAYFVVVRFRSVRPARDLDNLDCYKIVVQSAWKLRVPSWTESSDFSLVGFH